MEGDICVGWTTRGWCEGPSGLSTREAGWLCYLLHTRLTLQGHLEPEIVRLQLHIQCLSFVSLGDNGKRHQQICVDGTAVSRMLLAH